MSSCTVLLSSPNQDTSEKRRSSHLPKRLLFAFLGAANAFGPSTTTVIRGEIGGDVGPSADVGSSLLGFRWAGRFCNFHLESLGGEVNRTPLRLSTEILGISRVNIACACPHSVANLDFLETACRGLLCFNASVKPLVKHLTPDSPTRLEPGDTPGVEPPATTTNSPW